MKKCRHTIIIIISLMFVTACSDKATEKQETLTEPQIRALEKAKSVEQIMYQSEVDRRQQMEEQSR